MRWTYPSVTARIADSFFKQKEILPSEPIEDEEDEYEDEEEYNNLILDDSMLE